MHDQIKRYFAVFCLIVGASFTSANAQVFEPQIDSQSGRIFAYRIHNEPKNQAAKLVGASEGDLDPTAIASSFIAANYQRLGLGTRGVSLKALAPERDEVSYRQRYIQLYRRVPVYGADFSVHMNRAGEVVYVKAKLADELPAMVRPKISRAAAQKRVRTLAKKVIGNARLNFLNMSLLILPLGFIDNTPDINARLAWKLDAVDQKTGGTTYSETFFIDAQTGQKLMQMSGHMTLFREVYDCAAEDGYIDGNRQLNGHDYTNVAPNSHDVLPLPLSVQTDAVSTLFPPYVFGRSEGKPARGPHPNPYAETWIGPPDPLMPPPEPPRTFPTPMKFYQTTEVDYLYDLLADLDSYISIHLSIFNGPNGSGGTGKGIVPAGATRGWANADQCSLPPFYDYTVCPGTGTYNRADGSIYLCLGSATPDVAGHEYFHAVIDFSGVKSFTYSGMPGALQEGSADFMGEAFELSKTGATDWRTRTSPLFPPLIDLANPSAIHSPYFLPYRGYPNRYYSPDYYCGTFDSSGVHINSTVISHALYLIAMGGELNGCEIQPQGSAVAEKILFRGWRTKFSRSVSFAEAYTDLNLACSELFSTGVCNEVKKALQAVEMNQPGRCTAVPESAPACAKKNAGVIQGTKTTHADSSVFTFGEQILVHGSSATLGKTVHVRLLPHVDARPEWSDLHSVSYIPYTFESSEYYIGPLTTATAAGTYDIIIDGNKDGFFQSWADSVAVIQIKGNVDGDGVCYQGDSYQTSESCYTAPNDCACQSGYTCQDMTCPGDLTGLPPVYMCVQNRQLDPDRPSRCVSF